MSNLREIGNEVLSQIAGGPASDAIVKLAKGEEFGAPIAQLALDFAFGSVWAREERLTRRERSLIVISALTALRATGELRAHFGVGLTNGLTKEEIEETLVQLVPYVGFPAVMHALGLANEVLAECDAH